MKGGFFFLFGPYWDATWNSLSSWSCNAGQCARNPRTMHTRWELWNQWLENINLPKRSGLELLTVTQSPVPLTLHTFWGSSLDWSVGGKVQERLASLLEGTEQ